MKIVNILALVIVTASVSAGRADDGCSDVRWNWRSADELTWKQSIGRNKRISSAERERLLATLGSEAAESGLSRDEVRKNLIESRIKYADLNGDGKAEVLVQGGGDQFCSPTGNCPFWVLRRRGGNYVTILSADAQTFTVQPGSTKGFRDVVLTRHASAFESDAKLFRFNGSKYEEVKSFTVEWYTSPDPAGKEERKPLKVPKLTDCSK